MTKQRSDPEVWATLLTLCGIDCRAMDLFTCYEKYFQILADKDFTAKRVALNLPQDELSYEQVLRRMTPEEKLSLRERVTGVIPLKK